MSIKRISMIVLLTLLFTVYISKPLNAGMDYQTFSQLSDKEKIVFYAGILSGLEIVAKMKGSGYLHPICLPDLNPIILDAAIKFYIDHDNIKLTNKTDMSMIIRLSLFKAFPCNN